MSDMEPDSGPFRTCVNLLILALLLPVAFAQGTASLRGKVVDITLAVVPNTDIELIGNSQKSKTVSNERGEYSFESLTPGEYELHAVQLGFKTFTVKNLQVRAGVRLLDLPLEVGAMGCAGPLDHYELLDTSDLAEFEVHISRTPYKSQRSQPASNVTVRLVRTAGGGHQAQTDKVGIAVFKGIQPGDYRATAPFEGPFLNAIAGWRTVAKVDLPPDRCPDTGCDDSHPPLPVQIIVCE